MIGTEEEQLIFNDRATQAAAKLIALELIDLRSKEIPGVQVAVPDEVESRSVEFICTRLRHDIYDGSRTSPILGAVAVALNAEFLQRIRVGKWDY